MSTAQQQFFWENCGAGHFGIPLIIFDSHVHSCTHLLFDGGVPSTNQCEEDRNGARFIFCHPQSRLNL